jgi:dTMP kinase
MKKGILVVFTGIDGSGKTTQAKLLVKDLKDRGVNVSYVWCRWEPLIIKPFIRIWKQKKGRKWQENKAQSYRVMQRDKERMLRNPIYRSLWLFSFFIDYGLQIFLKIRIRLLRKRLIISDRIFYDSIIDQAINLGKKRNGLLNSLDSFWIKIFFPEPDMVIYIDCPEEIAFSRKHDIFIPDMEYLKERRKLYMELVDRYGWIKIDGTLPVDEIADQIKDKVYKRLRV